MRPEREAPGGDRSKEAVIGAVVTAFFPDDRLQQLVDELVGQAQFVVVVDNTPTHVAEEVVQRSGRLRYIYTGENIGLAGALNTGVRVLTHGCDVTHISFWDQDSLPPPGYLNAALTRANALPRSPRTIVSGSHGSGWARIERALTKPDRELPLLITSGMVVPRPVLDAVGSFREDFFVDAVDFDYSMRARSAGVSLHRFPELVIQHRLGDPNRGQRLIGTKLRTSGHPPWRQYWICRNTSILLTEHRASDPATIRTLRTVLAFWLAIVLLGGPDRWQVLVAAVAGWRDARRRTVRAAYDPRQAGVERRPPGA